MDRVEVMKRADALVRIAQRSESKNHVGRDMARRGEES